MNHYRGKTAIVTGGGSGIGRALALELGAAGARVVVTDIDRGRIDAVLAELEQAGVEAGGYEVDHGDLEAVRAFRTAFHNDWGQPDVLCLNAGVAISSELREMRIEDWEWVMRVNLWGTVYMTQEFLPPLIERGRGGAVLITASLAGLLGLPGNSAYCASKFALVGLAESLRAELKKHRIAVTALCPGIVRTNLTRDGRIGLEQQGIDREVVARLWERIGEDPRAVARKGLAGLRRGVAVVPSSFAYVGVPWLLKRRAGQLLNTGLGLAWRLQDRLLGRRAPRALDRDELELRDLLSLSSAELDQLYDASATPDLGELDGDYQGLLIEGQLPRLRSRFPIGAVNRSWLPWKGKAFWGGTAGRNRFEVGPLKGGTWNFATAIAASRFGGEHSCHVDYDIEGNARWLRRGVFDEMKQVREGLYLGKGGIQLFGTPRFVFYWAIEAATKPSPSAARSHRSGRRSLASTR